jgi:hypothetical protein
MTTTNVKQIRDANDVFADLDDGLTTKASIPTAQQVLARQKEQHQVSAASPDAINMYLANLGGGGAFLKFGKDGKFRTSDDEEVGEDRELVVIYDQASVGFIKFGAKGVPPEKVMGLLFDGYVPPKRAELGDNDPSAWDTGLDGRPQDPWRSQIELPLVDAVTGEKFTFATTSVTGRRAAGNLLSQCSRMRRGDPDSYPTITLKAGGFNHAKFGRVPTPSFVLKGKVAKANY